MTTSTDLGPVAWLNFRFEPNKSTETSKCQEALRQILHSGDSCDGLCQAASSLASFPRNPKGLNFPKAKRPDQSDHLFILLFFGQGPPVFPVLAKFLSFSCFGQDFVIALTGEPCVTGSFGQLRGGYSSIHKRNLQEVHSRVFSGSTKICRRVEV